MALDQTVVLGIGAACHIKSDEPAILVAFLRFLTEMNDTTAQAFFKVINSINPEWLEGGMALVTRCLLMVGAPS